MENQQEGVSIEELHKEIDLIQSCITRMAQNSFMVKGWGFTLVAAMAALMANKVSPGIICGAGIFILLFFWYLDAFFLMQEKLYRFKYEWVIEERPKGNRKFLYDLNPWNKEMWKASRKPLHVWQVMISKPCTLLLFYGIPIVIGAVIIILSYV